VKCYFRTIFHSVLHVPVKHINGLPVLDGKYDTSDRNAPVITTSAYRKTALVNAGCYSYTVVITRAARHKSLLIPLKTKVCPTMGSTSNLHHHNNVVSSARAINGNDIMRLWSVSRVLSVLDVSYTCNMPTTFKNRFLTMRYWVRLGYYYTIPGCKYDLLFF